MPVCKLTDVPAAGEEYHLAPTKLLSGNPKQTLWMQYIDPSKKFFASVWHSEVGKWKVSYTEEEHCHLLEGMSVITDNAGRAVTVAVGESFVVPRGFVGTWEVVEPTRKRFVIYEPGARRPRATPMGRSSASRQGVGLAGWLLASFVTGGIGGLASVKAAGSMFMFWLLHCAAALLLVPYLAWVSFAAALNFALWRLNPTALG